MLQFILVNIFFISLGVILYLFVRALPRVEDEPATPKQAIVQKWLSSGVPEKFDVAFIAFSEKFLRRAKIFLLRIDNVITERLKKIKNPGTRMNEAIKFEEIRNDNTKNDNSVQATDSKD